MTKEQIFSFSNELAEIEVITIHYLTKIASKYGIDFRDAKDILSTSISSYTWSDLIKCSILNNMPSYQSWIPTTEHEPFKSGYYLVTIKGVEEPTILWYSKMDALWRDDEYNYYTVLAWQPLPEPYQEANNEQHDQNITNIM